MYETTVGFIIAVLTCYGSEYSCDVKPYEAPVIVYAAPFDCQWKLDAIPYSERQNQRIECVPVKRQVK